MNLWQATHGRNHICPACAGMNLEKGKLRKDGENLPCRRGDKPKLSLKLKVQMVVTPAYAGIEV